MPRTVLLTGFEPYGGRDLNPSAEIVKALDGQEVCGARVAGHVLPVSLDRLPRALEEVLSGPPPAAVVSLGLAPGEPMIRLERIGVNLAEFEIPDNDGRVLQDAPLHTLGRDGLFSTLPLRRIEARLLAEGIPVRLSMTAGTYLCNATLYTCLGMLRERDWQTPCGFIHLPYLPRQVADMLAAMNRTRFNDLVRREYLPSMDLATQIRAVELTLKETLGSP
jgi:pyroglutamyl-peptidase